MGIHNYKDYMESRPEMVESLERYVEHGISTGGFLDAVLKNNLKGACEKADSENQRHLWDVVCYCYNQIPYECRGSEEIVNMWKISKGRGEI